MEKFLDNKEEIITGFIFVLLFSLPLGVPNCVYVSLFGSILWRLGGSYNKLYRRLGIPVLTGIVLFWLYQNPIIFITVPLLFGVLSIGYGIPSVNDGGSALGKIIYKLVGKKEALATVVTRCILGLLMMVAMPPLAFVALSHYLFVLIAWPILYALMDLLVAE